MATKTYIASTGKEWRGIGVAIAKGISKPVENARPYFQGLSLRVDQDTQLTFRNKGSRAGHPAWRGYSPATLRMPSGRFNIRYGTDLKGRAKGSYVPGVVRKGIRRYSSQSRMFMASGGFRKAFSEIRVDKNNMTYGLAEGTWKKLGKDIMSKPERQVLFVTKLDRMRWGLLWHNFIDKGIKFT